MAQQGEITSGLLVFRLLFREKSCQCDDLRVNALGANSGVGFAILLSVGSHVEDCV